MRCENCIKLEKKVKRLEGELDMFKRIRDTHLGYIAALAAEIQRNREGAIALLESVKEKIRGK